MAEHRIDLTPDDDRPPPVVSPDTPGGDLIGGEYEKVYPPGSEPWPEPEPAVEAPRPVEPMTEAEVADMLENVAGWLGMVLPNANTPDLWEFTAPEVESLAPPLTRVINKRPAAVLVLQRTDELVVALAIGKYVLSRARYVRAVVDTEERPEGTDADIGLDGDRGPEVFPND